MAIPQIILILTAVLGNYEKPTVKQSRETLRSDPIEFKLSVNFSISKAYFGLSPILNGSGVGSKKNFFDTGFLYLHICKRICNVLIRFLRHDDIT